MKCKVIIEEVISQEFEVDIDTEDNIYDQIKKLYKQQKLVVDNPKLIQTNFMLKDEHGNETDWINLI